MEAASKWVHHFQRSKGEIAALWRYDKMTESMSSQAAIIMKDHLEAY